jgi:membrane protease YdiL (CAAX protease family)
MTSALHLARLLAFYRLRSLWNAFWHVPQRRTMRVAWLMMLIAPVAYVGLFASAFSALRQVAGAAEQEALLSVVCGAIVLASGLAKMATNDVVVAGSGANEFLLTRPLSLATLLVARSLAGVVTDLFDALFLFPVLLAASLAWHLGAAGAGLALVSSALIQIAVSAASQAGQIAVVRLVRPTRRRAVWALLGLLAALAMAGVWILGTLVVRSPTRVIDHLMGWAGWILKSPLGPPVAPLSALAAGNGTGVAWGMTFLLNEVALILVLAFVFARWASADGWEHAGLPWVEAAPDAASRRPGPSTPFGKELLLLSRDRTRLLALAVAPAIFVGIQIFGSAGWDWIAASPQHAAMMAFSLSAYLATAGPLAHMNSERHAFWLLRMSPFPLGRLMAWKALFWAMVVGSMAGLAYLGVWIFAPLPNNAQTFGLGLLAVAGAVAAACLAVAMGCNAADLSDDRRPVVNLTTAWLFMITAALFNTALMGDGQIRARALALFAVGVVLHWMTGIENLSLAYDAEHQARRRILPGDGAGLAILLYLGQKVGNLGIPASPEVVLGGAIWSGILSAFAIGQLWRTPGVHPARGWLASLLMAVVVAAAGAQALPTYRALHAWDISLAGLLLGGLAEEVIVRGLVQRPLSERWPSLRGQVAALLVSIGVAWLAGRNPLSLASLMVAATGAVTWAATRRTWAAVLARTLLEFFP